MQQQQQQPTAPNAPTSEEKIFPSIETPDLGTSECIPAFLCVCSQGLRLSGHPLTTRPDSVKLIYCRREPNVFIKISPSFVFSCSLNVIRLPFFFFLSVRFFLSLHLVQFSGSLAVSLFSLETCHYKLPFQPCCWPWKPKESLRVPLSSFCSSSRYPTPSCTSLSQDLFYYFSHSTLSS